jgi:hypothetical protein
MSDARRARSLLVREAGHELPEPLGSFDVYVHALILMPYSWVDLAASSPQLTLENALRLLFV